jgi:hypothetical protein
MDTRYVNEGVDIIEDLMELQEAADIVGPTGEEMVLVAHDQGHGHGTLRAASTEGGAPEQDAPADDAAGGSLEPE